MAYTKAGGEAVNRYSKKAYDDLRIRVKKGEKEIIQARAKELDKSLNQYVTDLIKEDIKKSNT
ncbi:MAG: toxin-antitoxin system HicB family antitoxin [Oscillospiraceae bacterium]|nr:toxin-antitoxin system HicB family antitoxin [Oscillospiraceae bacterium]